MFGSICAEIIAKQNQLAGFCMSAAVAFNGLMNVKNPHVPSLKGKLHFLCSADEHTI